MAKKGVHENTVMTCGRRGFQLYAFFTFSLDGPKLLAAYLNHAMPGKGSLIYILQEDVWAPHPVWTFWRRGNLLSLPGNKPLFFSCPAGSPFTTSNELSCLMYNCVCLTGRTCNIGTAFQSIVKHSQSGQLEKMKIIGAHPRGGACKPHPSSNIEIKKTVFVDMMLSSVLGD